MACQKLQTKCNKETTTNKTENQNEFLIYALFSWQPGQMVVYKCLGEFFPSRIYMSPVTIIIKWVFAAVQWHFAEHISTWEPPMVSFCLWMAEQQVNDAHKAAAIALIIKEAWHLSFCIVPSHDGHKLLDYPFHRLFGKIIIWCPLITVAIIWKLAFQQNASLLSGNDSFIRKLSHGWW